ncbi:MAG TPA: hypothetical protein ENO08_05250, partial [Candidatus Eisenbacteria bacterium]|nr:hypothetical protein [Candidatus Eisenbacteria bacterium]
MDGNRSCETVFYAMIALACASLALFLLAAPMERVLTIVPDDASYYFEIADNAASGEGFTFDRLGETNGYQPLWLYLLVPFYRIVPAGPGTMVRVITIFQVLLSGAAGLFLHGLLRRASSACAALAGGSLFAAFVIAPAVNGMESALLVLLLVVLAGRAVRSGFPDRCGAGEAFRLGLLLGLAVLARLDTAFLCVSTGLLLLAGAAAGGAGRRRIALLAATALGASLIILPYLSYNAIRFGSPMPISGLLKSSFPVPAFDPAMLLEPGPIGLLSLLLGA